MQPSLFDVALNASSLSKHFECFKNIYETDARFTKLLDKILRGIGEVHTFLTLNCAQMVSKDVSAYTAEEYKILKLVKNILHAGKDFGALQSENPSVKLIQSTMNSWKRNLPSKTARPFTDCTEPPFKKARLNNSATNYSFNGLPDEILCHIGSYVEKLPLLKLFFINHRLYQIYCQDPNPIMLGMRVVNHTFAKINADLGGVNLLTFTENYRKSDTPKLSQAFAVTDDFEIVCLKNLLFKAMDEESMTPEAIFKSFSSLIFSDSAYFGCFMEELFYRIFPNAHLTLSTAQAFAPAFENFASKLNLGHSVKNVDFKTGVLIEFINKTPELLNHLPPDLIFLAWQELAARVDLSIVPSKLNLLISLLYLAGNEKYYPHLPALHADINSVKALMGFPSRVQDLSQALAKACSSPPENKFRDFKHIFEQHLKGMWKLELYQIAQILIELEKTELTGGNSDDYRGSWDLEESHLRACCKLADPLLEILIKQLNDKNKDTITSLTNNLCKYIRNLIEIDLNMYQEDVVTGHGHETVPSNFGIILQQIDKIDPTLSAPLFEDLANWLQCFLKKEDNWDFIELDEFISQMLRWDSDLIHTFLNQTFKKKNEIYETLRACAIEQYANYDPIAAIHMAYTWCQTPKRCLESLASTLTKIKANTPGIDVEISKAIHYLQHALEKDEALDSTNFIVNLATLDFEKAQQLALEVKNIDHRSLCCLKIAQANRTKYSADFYQHPDIIEKFTRATSPIETKFNRLVFDFIFNQTDVIEGLRQLSGRFEHFYIPDRWAEALLKAGVPSQALFEFIQEMSGRCLFQNSDPLRLWLLKKGYHLMKREAIFKKICTDGIFSSVSM